MEEQTQPEATDPMPEATEEQNELPLEGAEEQSDVTAESTDDNLNEDVLPEGHKSGFVAVVGAPNAGKSTLMNALLKQKIAIVSPRPQTTRTRQLGILTEDTHQIIFVDTPGLIKKAMHMLDEVMVDTVLESVDGADAILWMVDASQLPTASDRAVAELLKPMTGKLPLILAMNKIDIMQVEQVRRNHVAYLELLPDVPWILFSAETGAGLPELYKMILEALPEGPRFYPPDQITDAYVRVIAAEMVREQILIRTRDEIPHSVAVQVDQFEQREDDLIYIHATVYVERDTHKKIIIGAKGANLRRIGTGARKEIQKLIDSKLFLDLHVKVAPKWRRNPKMLQQFGYAPPKG